MLKFLKILKFRNEIAEICKINGYDLIGNIRKCNIDDNQWTFAVKTPDKSFLVKLIVPFGCFNTGLCFNSPEYISASATILAMRGQFGSLNIPITREYHFKLPENGFELDVDKTNKIFLVFPKCKQFYIRDFDKQRLLPFRVGVRIGDISIHDGASFRYLLNNPNDVRRFAEFGE